MPHIQCRTCQGKGKILVPRANTKGETVYVLEDCKDCYGSGVIPK
jgi:DnaJ-class molecular chaperone